MKAKIEQGGGLRIWVEWENSTVYQMMEGWMQLSAFFDLSFKGNVRTSRTLDLVSEHTLGCVTLSPAAERKLPWWKWRLCIDKYQH